MRTFGFKLVLLGICSILVSVLSLYIALYQHSEQQKQIEKIHGVVQENLFNLNLLSTPGVLRIISRQEYKTKSYLARLDSLRDLVGDPFIDERLRDITELIFSDLVTPWLSTLTSEADVSEDLRSLLFSVIRNISVRFGSSMVKFYSI